MLRNPTKKTSQILQEDFKATKYGHWEHLAESYDAIMQRVSIMEELYDAIIHALPENVKQVLDLGTGTGTLLERIGVKYPDCKMIGLDVAPAMLENAKAKFRNMDNVSFIQGSAANPKFSNSVRFDAIVSNYALHHLTDTEKAECARQCYSLLRKGGRFIFGDQHCRRMGETVDKEWVVDMFDLLCAKAKHYLQTASLERMILQIKLMPNFILKEGELPVTVEYWLDILNQAGFNDVKVMSLEPIDLLNRVIVATKG